MNYLLPANFAGTKAKSKKKAEASSSSHMTKEEEIADIKARLARNEKVSNREKRQLKKHEESMAEEAAMMAEFESGLANFSLSVSGASAGGAFAHTHIRTSYMCIYLRMHERIFIFPCMHVCIHLLF